MRKLITVLAALAGLSLIVDDAEARRMSGGRSVGQQRQSVTPNQAKQSPPAQQQAAPAQKQATPATPPAPQPSGWRKWLGPLAGLAIGAALASLFLNNGLGGALMGILLVAALVFGAVMLFRLFRGSRTREPLSYAGGPQPDRGVEPVLRNPAPAVPLGGGAAPHSVAASVQSDASNPAAQIEGFDAEQFLRHARMNFTNLQAAYDRRDLSTIRDFMTPQMYREIEADVRASAGTPEKTEIVTLNAEVADVATENNLYVVSVRFSGLIREAPGAEATPFSEVWHLEKPTNGSSGWLLSGIQQV